MTLCAALRGVLAGGVNAQKEARANPPLHTAIGKLADQLGRIAGAIDNFDGRLGHAEARLRAHKTPSTP